MFEYLHYFFILISEATKANDIKCGHKVALTSRLILNLI
jgi:hypothetical protein